MSLPLDVTPANLMSVWDLLTRTSAAFYSLVEEMPDAVSAEQRLEHTHRLAAIHDDLIKISNSIHLAMFAVGMDRRVGPRPERRRS